MAIPKTRAEEVVLGDREGGAKQYSYFYEQYWADQVGQGGGQGRVVFLCLGKY